jgi:hypothetical protein
MIVTGVRRQGRCQRPALEDALRDLAELDLN